MSDDPRKPQVRPTTAAALYRQLAIEQSDGRLPSVTAGVVRDGAVVWVDRRGDFGVGDPAAPPADVQYRIGSITKPFTAVLVARLRDEGQLDFNDPLERHLPGTPMGDRTIAQLLAHMGGLRSEIDGEWWERIPGLSWAELANLLGPESVRMPAGRRPHYSNLGYAALGALVARKRGQSWYDVLRTEVLDPLEMRRTTYHPEAPHAAGYAVHPFADLVQPEPAHDAGAGAPAGQLWSTVTDLARWAAFIAGDTGDVLDPATMAELREPRVGVSSTERFGLGFQLSEVAGRTLVGHGGSMPGFLAGVWVEIVDSPAGGGHDGVVFFANGTTGLDPGRLAGGLFGVLTTAEPRLPREWKPAAEVPQNALELAGPWYWGPTPYAIHVVADGLLHLRPLAKRGRGSRFRPDGPDRWIGLDNYYSAESLVVCRHPDGRVSHLNLGTFVFTRTPYDPEAPVPGGVDPEGWQTGR